MTVYAMVDLNAWKDSTGAPGMILKSIPAGTAGTVPTAQFLSDSIYVEVHWGDGYSTPCNKFCVSRDLEDLVRRNLIA